MSQAQGKNNTQVLPDRTRTEMELDKDFPAQPHNHSQTLPFHDLYLTLFNPLNENSKKKPAQAVLARRQRGHNGPSKLPKMEIRDNIIAKFISRWRQEVGDDIFPAFRLIIPEKDRERAMYGLKEKIIAKLLVKIMRIDPNSEDAQSILTWKGPGKTTASKAMAGDFARRCYAVLLKRPMRVAVGDMTVEEVNDLLDELSAVSREDRQLLILQKFYRRMNPEELMWLIRIILRHMSIGATEKTFLKAWHPDAETLFNVSSSLRKVCWELHSRSINLDDKKKKITLMQCFQPQLAQHVKQSFEQMVVKLRLTEDDPTFWIEDKLDGERMQLHMKTDESVPGGKKFRFWSRKGKEYTYLYGGGFEDETSALTRHLKDAFEDGVNSIILDGEMITWDPEQDKMVPFGTLKTAALAMKENPFSTGIRPLYCIFDILHLNDEPLTQYPLRERRNALDQCVKPIDRRMVIHPYIIASSATEIEPLLRKVIEEASEGLVLKNPRSMYHLDDRNDDWIKVKPEYMDEYGESLDCVIIGGYYGSGHRGGNLSSFLCGLRVDKAPGSRDAEPMKFFSFFKVGGGIAAADYATIRHQTDGKWKDWDQKKPPVEYIELGGHERNLQYERPDVWIKPDESLVIEVKAASVASTDQFRVNMTLRFPRFKKLRGDKDWKTALSIQEFHELKADVEKERKRKAMTVDDSRRKRLKTASRKPLTVAGYNNAPQTLLEGPSTEVFKGLSFYVITESLTPEKRSKIELEQFIKANGGKIFQSQNAEKGIICIGDRRTVKAAALQKGGIHNIVRPKWIFDCIKQSLADPGLPEFRVPFEPGHMFFASEENPVDTSENVDQYQDSFSRNTTLAELKETLGNMKLKAGDKKGGRDLREMLLSEEEDFESLPGLMFKGKTFYFDELQQMPSNGNASDVLDSALHSKLQTTMALRTARFAGAKISDDLKDENITHIVVDASGDVRSIRERLIRRRALPRIVTPDFIQECWKEKTLLDEERFAPI